ncbi:hypothetical protein QVD17_16819 [Tagetes erecta]|uniref:Uncharacterized protein n=1 Tax=Tagetes erecta TaxID=13708 RepID=A0AAD8KVJ8_TARER|nr:hypothetical protein QVD17_16819 [Tagetes erecta]
MLYHLSLLSAILFAFYGSMVTTGFQQGYDGDAVVFIVLYSISVFPTIHAFFGWFLVVCDGSDVASFDSMAWQRLWSVGITLQPLFVQLFSLLSVDVDGGHGSL